MDGDDEATPGWRRRSSPPVSRPTRHELTRRRRVCIRQRAALEHELARLGVRIVEEEGGRGGRRGVFYGAAEEEGGPSNPSSTNRHHAEALFQELRMYDQKLEDLELELGLEAESDDGEQPQQSDPRLAEQMAMSGAETTPSQSIAEISSEELAEQMATSGAVTTPSQSIVEIPTEEVKMDVGGLQEQHESPHWMSNLLDLEVDEDMEDEDVCSDKQMAEEGDVERVIRQLEEKHGKDINPIFLALSVLIEMDVEVDVEVEEVPQQDDEEEEKLLCELDDYLSRHTYHSMKECIAGVANGFQNPPCPHFHNHTHEKTLKRHRACISRREDPRMEKVSDRKQIENGLKWMSEECFLAFGKYAEQLNFQDTESKFGELLKQCFSVETYDKVFHHYNFTIETKNKDSDIWKSQLYFAEVKQLCGLKYFMCCPLDASDNGNCYGCKNQDMKDLKHPAGGGYVEGDSEICWPFMDDAASLSGSDDGSELG